MPPGNSGRRLSCRTGSIHHPPCRPPLMSTTRCVSCLAAAAPEGGYQGYSMKAKGAEIGDLLGISSAREQERAETAQRTASAMPSRRNVCRVRCGGARASRRCWACCSPPRMTRSSQLLPRWDTGSIPDSARPVGVSFDVVLHRSWRFRRRHRRVLSDALDVDNGLRMSMLCSKRCVREVICGFTILTGCGRRIAGPVNDRRDVAEARRAAGDSRPGRNPPVDAPGS